MGSNPLATGALSRKIGCPPTRRT